MAVGVGLDDPDQGMGPCPLLQVGARLLVLGCPARKGDSGAPVLAGRGDAARIVGIVVGRAGSRSAPRALVLRLWPALDLLRGPGRR